MIGNRTSITPPLAASKVTPLLWICASTTIAMLVGFALLSRLGLPIELIVYGTLAVLIAGVATVSVTGRTMNSPIYFFAERSAPSSVTGFAGGTDFCLASFIILFLSSDFENRAILLGGMMTGALLISALFSTTPYRSGVSTLAGFFAWRNRGSGAGSISIPIASGVMLILCACELKIGAVAITALTGLDEQVAFVIITATALTPILLGGWQAVTMTNLVLALSVLLCLAFPTALLTLFPGSISVESQLSQDLADFPLLLFPASAESGAGSIFFTAIALAVTAAGFATLPHAVSRMVLVKRPNAAQEHFGWIALFTFIVISTLPLTLEVITSEGDENWQSLASRPVFHMLPYLALLLIAVNGFSATMLGFAASLARGVQRSRNRDPGERSMFGTRALSVIAAAALVGAVQRYDVQIELLFPIALGLSASAFFAPLIAANWVGSIVRFFDSAAITAGAFVFAALVLPPLSSGDQLSSAEIVTHAAFGMSASFSILLTGKVIGILRPDLAADPTGRIIRGED